MGALTATAVAQSQRFPDVPTYHYAFEAVEWAAEVGVTAGYTDGTFKPHRPLIKHHAVVFIERFYDEILQAEESEDFTRADMMVLLKAINDVTLNNTGTAAESAEAEATPRFPDVPTHHYAFEAVEWAAEVGVTAGYTDGTFKPHRPLIKHHAVVFIERFYDEILQAEESEDFTRADMMVLLKAINDGTLNNGTSTKPEQTPDSDPAASDSSESNTDPDEPEQTPSSGQSDGPSGYGLGASVCKPYGTDGTTAGFPLPRWAAPSVGTMRVAVLFVDFADAEAAHTTQQEAASSLARGEEFLERSSYGWLNVEFTPLHRWLRARHNVGHYLVNGRLDWAQTLNEAVQLADPEFDFTGHDVVMIVHPSTHFSVVSAAFRAAPVTTDEAVVPSVTGINLTRRWLSQDGVDPWGRDAAHELAHALGLLDLYLYGRAETREAPEGKVWVNRRYGLMGLAVQHLADNLDPRFRATWYFANGGTATSFETAAYEMLAWSRWQLGWLDTWQVRCINQAEATVSLSPVASPGGGTAMAAVPLSGTEMIVLESRRNLGYDTAYEVTSNGATVSRPAPIEGVLVYTVDTSLPSGRLPLKVAGDTGDQRIGRDPILTAGQSITVRGYTITFVSDNGLTHTVSITKTHD